MPDAADIEAIARARLRTMRQSLGWSLDELAARAHLSPSTISRIETGKRTMSIDVLLALSRALHVDISELLELGTEDEDVVIRPHSTSTPGRTTWPLSRASSSTIAIKVRIEAGAPRGEPSVHPGHDWFFVLSGRVLLTLGERQVEVVAGEAAEFSTMVPHALDALDEPAELIMLFDRDGQLAHIGGTT
ncbi:MAG: helix-turn-helix domain-containing protein [Ilumatobacteraceae bacterium]